MRRMANVVGVAERCLIQHHRLLILRHHGIDNTLRNLEHVLEVFRRHVRLDLMPAASEIVLILPPHLIESIDILLMNDIRQHGSVMSSTSHKALRHRA
eukprot:CAMPEP_0178462928 /NCGR_PEP_ID=MMETSP0689_2-20121128/50070_1 /TAXON_ID=160604 /ORGANISM="Amphidinium massartii, Strain CS-259" /LENGTH=97 /DNA_ID=CAMNT_0020089795 /DNA_START=349 /DNA_END=638 /DNA_ORIENTATION=-